MKECPGVADGDAPPDEKPLLDAVRGDTPNPTPVVDIADLEADLELLEVEESTESGAPSPGKRAKLSGGARKKDLGVIDLTLSDSDGE